MNTDSAKKIRNSILFGFIVTAVLLGAKLGFELTDVGHDFQRFTLEKLQNLLSFVNSREKPPVVVDDIGRLREGKDEVIDLNVLKEIVAAIAAEQPSSIGIDADITPADIDDPKEDAKSMEKIERYFAFLDFCLLLKQEGTPIFIGVSNRLNRGQAGWLGANKYKGLAASIFLTKGVQDRAPLWIKIHHEKLDSLSLALAGAYKAKSFQGYSSLVETEEGLPGSLKEIDDGNIEVFESLVNYSKLEDLQKGKQMAINATSIKDSGEQFRGRIVILGDDSKATDKFVVTGRNETVPGLFIHASSAYTLVQEPVYEFRILFRLLLDLLFSVIIIFGVAAMRKKNLRSAETYNWEKTQFKLNAFLTGSILLGAIFLILFFGILWLDFLLVGVSLWAHPKLEKLCTRSGKLHS